MARSASLIAPLLLLGLCLSAPAPAHGRRLLSANAVTKGGHPVVVKQLQFTKQPVVVIAHAKPAAAVAVHPKIASAPAHGRRLQSANAADAATKGGHHVVVKQLQFTKQPVVVTAHAKPAAAVAVHPKPAVAIVHKEINTTAVAELIHKHAQLVANFIAAKFNKTVVAQPAVAAAPVVAAPVVAATPAAASNAAAAASTTAAVVVASKGKGPFVAVTKATTAQPVAAETVVVAPAHTAVSVVASKGVAVSANA